MIVPGAPAAGEIEPILAVENLSKAFPLRHRLLGAKSTKAQVRAVDDVSFAIAPGETLALVGESGSGKTTAARCASLLLRPEGGAVRFHGSDMARAPDRLLKPMRRAVAQVFQDPFGSLNPRLPVSAILAEPLAIHAICRRSERRERVAGLLRSVGLPPESAERYPHAFSGGQRQRIAIARALASQPELIVADEPLSALDVTVRGQVLDLMLDLKETRGLAFLFISHDLAVVHAIADRVCVMYFGRIVEEAPRAELFAHPAHPYTRSLIEAIPVPGKGKRHWRQSIEAPRGEPPDPADPPRGCAFHPRCPLAQDRCRQEAPIARAVGQAPAGGATGQSAARHVAACHFA